LGPSQESKGISQDSSASNLGTLFGVAIMTDEEWEKIEQEWRDEDEEDDIFYKGMLILLLIPIAIAALVGLFFLVRYLCG
jgi:hypothetical protein